MVYVLHSFVGRRQHCLTTIVDWWRSSLATYNSQCPKKEKNSSKKYFCVPNQYVLKKKFTLNKFVGAIFRFVIYSFLKKIAFLPKISLF